MILQPPGIMLRIFSNKNSKPGNDAMRCKKKFLHYFKKGFNDPLYVEWERGYKWKAHEQWQGLLNKGEYDRLLSQKCKK